MRGEVIEDKSQRGTKQRYASHDAGEQPVSERDSLPTSRNSSRCCEGCPAHYDIHLKAFTERKSVALFDFPSTSNGWFPSGFHVSEQEVCQCQSMSSSLVSSKMCEGRVWKSQPWCKSQERLRAHFIQIWLLPGLMMPKMCGSKASERVLLFKAVH